MREAGRKEGFPEVGCVLAPGDWTSWLQRPGGEYVPSEGWSEGKGKEARHPKPHSTPARRPGGIPGSWQRSWTAICPHCGSLWREPLAHRPPEISPIPLHHHWGLWPGRNLTESSPVIRASPEVHPQVWDFDNCSVGSGISHWKCRPREAMRWQG